MWVRDNIELFGGDPERVTIMGQSTGAKCVGALLVMPEASGLFKQAIAQSGSIQSVRDRRTSTTIARRFIESIGLCVFPAPAPRQRMLPSIRFAPASIAASVLAHRQGQIVMTMKANVNLQALTECLNFFPYLMRKHGACRIEHINRIRPVAFHQFSLFNKLFHRSHVRHHPEADRFHPKLFGFRQMLCRNIRFCHMSPDPGHFWRRAWLLL
jgi:hypothetical protein